MMSSPQALLEEFSNNKIERLHYSKDISERNVLFWRSCSSMHCNFSCHWVALPNPMTKEKLQSGWQNTGQYLTTYFEKSVKHKIH